jgi:TonB family protein
MSTRLHRLESANGDKDQFDEWREAMRAHRLIRMAICGGFICLAGAAFAQPPAPKGSVSVVTNPEWLVRPTAAHLDRYYPPEAARQKLRGIVRLSCKIDQQGGLQHCRILSEQPPGAGFGEAALKLAPYFRMKPTTRNGAPLAGAHAIVPVRFAPDPVVRTT